MLLLLFSCFCDTAQQCNDVKLEGHISNYFSDERGPFLKRKETDLNLPDALM